MYRDPMVYILCIDRVYTHIYIDRNPFIASVQAFIHTYMAYIYSTYTLKFLTLTLTQK